MISWCPPPNAHLTRSQILGLPFCSQTGAADILGGDPNYKTIQINTMNIPYFLPQLEPLHLPSNPSGDSWSCPSLHRGILNYFHSPPAPILSSISTEPLGEMEAI